MTWLIVLICTLVAMGMFVLALHFSHYKRHYKKHNKKQRHGDCCSSNLVSNEGEQAEKTCCQDAGKKCSCAANI